jgi:hypothetical protein
MDSTLDEVLDAYIRYAKALEEILSGSTLNDLYEEISRLPDKADRIKDAAEPEFEALDVFNKAGAIAATVGNIAELRKIPDTVKKSIDGFK